MNINTRTHLDDDEIVVREILSNIPQGNLIVTYIRNNSTFLNLSTQHVYTCITCSTTSPIESTNNSLLLSSTTTSSTFNFNYQTTNNTSTDQTIPFKDIISIGLIEKHPNSPTITTIPPIGSSIILHYLKSTIIPLDIRSSRSVMMDEKDHVMGLIADINNQSLLDNVPISIITLSEYSYSNQQQPVKERQQFPIEESKSEIYTIKRMYTREDIKQIVEMMKVGDDIQFTSISGVQYEGILHSIDEEYEIFTIHNVRLTFSENGTLERGELASLKFNPSHIVAISITKKKESVPTNSNSSKLPMVGNPTRGGLFNNSTTTNNNKQGLFPSTSATKNENTPVSKNNNKKKAFAGFNNNSSSSVSSNPTSGSKSSNNFYTNNNSTSKVNTNNNNNTNSSKGFKPSNNNTKNNNSNNNNNVKDNDSNGKYKHVDIVNTKEWYSYQDEILCDDLVLLVLDANKELEKVETLIKNTPTFVYQLFAKYFSLELDEKIQIDDNGALITHFKNFNSSCNISKKSYIREYIFQIYKDQRNIILHNFLCVHIVAIIDFWKCFIEPFDVVLEHVLKRVNSILNNVNTSVSKKNSCNELINFIDECKKRNVEIVNNYNRLSNLIQTAINSYKEAIESHKKIIRQSANVELPTNLNTIQTLSISEPITIILNNVKTFNSKFKIKNQTTQTVSSNDKPIMNTHKNSSNEKVIIEKKNELDQVKNQLNNTPNVNIELIPETLANQYNSNSTDSIDSIELQIENYRENELILENITNISNDLEIIEKPILNSFIITDFIPEPKISQQPLIEPISTVKLPILQKENTSSTTFNVKQTLNSRLNDLLNEHVIKLEQIEYNFKNPFGISVYNNNIYITDRMSNVILMLDEYNNVQPIAGISHNGFINGDKNLAINCQLKGPSGICNSPNGEIYFCDTNNHRICKINLSSELEIIAGNGTSGYNGDNQLALEASLNFPHGICFANGEIYFCDTNNHRIRKIKQNGIIETIAGIGKKGFTNDNELAINSKIDSPTSIWYHAGEIYFSDNFNNRIRKIDNNGRIITIVGGGLNSTNNIIGHSAMNICLNDPSNIYINLNNDIFISDTGNNRILKIDSDLMIQRVIDLQLKCPNGVFENNQGEIFILDTGNKRVLKIG